MARNNQLNGGNRYATTHTYAGAPMRRVPGGGQTSDVERRRQALEAFYRQRSAALQQPGQAQPAQGGVWDYLSQLSLHPANLLRYVNDRYTAATGR